MNHDLVQGPGEGDYHYLWRTLWRRTVDPFKHLPFVIFMFLAVILFGGLGVWIEILKLSIATTTTWEGLITASMTFFPTLIGSTALQLVLASVNKGDKILISFGLLVLCIFVTFAILLPFFSALHPTGVLRISAACSLCAIWVWWITNGIDETFHRKPPDDAATGGPLNRPLAGSLAGFEI